MSIEVENSKLQDKYIISLVELSAEGDFIELARLIDQLTQELNWPVVSTHPEIIYLRLILSAVTNYAGLEKKNNEFEKKMVRNGFAYI